ncbi:protein HEXIM1 [Echeneis naucrates]|uniref:Protein HEXIM-like n=1 Tax=Echeneis naucrates TaxID=173247 RepID=A0A665U9L5_ECHNA|nr:protein HEXIM-like [Echeneis naucrates]XP_029363766.1 protein HEXIM-like [Echeneis naucrates]
MTEPAEQTHHLKTSACPSGGSGGDAPEHLPASNRGGGGGPVNGDRGRQREQKRRRQQQQQRAENCGDINTDKLWQMKGGQREVCPALAAGNQLSECPIATGPHQNSQIGAADGKPGQDRPLQETLNRVQDESLHVDSDTGLDARLGKKRHRRRTSKKKRNWKPYYKLSWEEKKALEEKETARASRLREEMFAKGLPVAPYNTTQFLMDEHDREEPDLNTETGVRRPSGVGLRMEDTGSEEDLFDNDEEEDDDGSGGGSDGIGRAGNAGGEFLQRDFSETYEMYHVESLQNMTKQELVQEYLELEKCMSRLEEENNRLRRAMEPGGLTVEGSLVRLRELERELERLRAQNTELLLQSQPGKDRAPVATN